MNIPDKKNFPFYLLAVAIVIILVLPSLLKEGMFVDGTLYAAIARNLSQNIGSIWHLRANETGFASFYGHPPLVFVLQSGFFKVFSDHLFVERLYSFLTLIFSSLMLAVLWRKSSKDIFKSYGWLPIICWIITPVVLWSYANNMLENTLTIFLLAAVLFIHKANELDFRKSVLFYLTGGLFVFAGAMSKGPVALFPLAAVFIHWIVYRHFNFGNMLSRSLIPVLTVTVLLLLLLGLGTDAQYSMEQYLHGQILKSLRGENETADRFFAIRELIFSLVPMVILVTAIVLAAGRKGRLFHWNEQTRKVIYFVLIGLSASLPILISPKQMWVYLAPSIPFFALGAAHFIIPVVYHRIEMILNVTKTRRILLTVSILTLLSTIAYASSQYGKPGKDAALIEDVKTIGNHVGKNQIVDVSPELCNQWGPSAYFNRYYSISFDCTPVKHQYMILPKDAEHPDSLKQIPLKLHSYVLVEQKSGF